MTIKELIVELQKYADDTPVLFPLHSLYYPVEKVKGDRMIQKGGYYDYPYPYLPHETTRTTVDVVVLGD